MVAAGRGRGRLPIRRRARGIVSAPVTRPVRLIAVSALPLALVVAACGGGGIKVAEDDPAYRGAELFQQRCSGCHTLNAAGAAGSKPANLRSSRDRTDGPNFDQRTESVDDVLFAIRNGGFSGAIMPANIAVGDDAQAIAEFVAEYAGGGSSESSSTEP